MEQVNLQKFKEYKNGMTFEFRYEGIPSNVFDKEKVEKLIDTFLNKEALHRDMLRNVTYIRTILNTAKEKLLVVECSDKDNKETVKYDNGILFSYECKQYDVESSNYMEVNFTPGSALNISFSDFEEECIIKYPNTEATKDKFDKVLDYIDSLANVSAVYLDNDSKALIEIYKLFYNDNPDFSKEDINIKVQTMMSILAQFNIYFGDYSFSINEDMPESVTLLQMVNRLFPLGEVVAVEDPIELRERAKQTIKIVGETIRTTIGDETDINEALITISKTVYAARYDITSMYDVKKLVEYPNLNLTFSEVENSVQLVKTIERKIYENV